MHVCVCVCVCVCVLSRVHTARNVRTCMARTPSLSVGHRVCVASTKRVPTGSSTSGTACQRPGTRRVRGEVIVHEYVRLEYLSTLYALTILA